MQTAAGSWCKGAAAQNGVDQTSGDVLVIADGDVWCDGMLDAIDAVAGGAPWAVPHLLLHRLTEAATASVLAGVPPHPGMPLAVLTKPYKGFLGGGVVVLRRDVWDECPIDVRFLDWGHDDESWAVALGHLYGPPRRFDSTLWHLWHPPQERITWGLGSLDNKALYERYHHASRNPDRSAMRSLIAEGKAQLAQRR